ncbi:MFS transporter [Longimicrobium sp.]|uniref:MFS transporter n=1 Tax=Longimicrobium sp. TaxID=2029185 RepID=UPI002CD406B0|nr:MFS transporter [Longimicrobium sp.]HSU15977.1 MFS transporter [Longimicrobium sp.]
MFLTVFLDLVGFGIVIPLLPLYAARFGAGPVAVAWLLAVYSLMQFFFAPWWGRVSDRVGRRPVLLLGLFGSAASYLAFGLAGSLPVLFVARAANGLAGANVGVAQAYVADVTGPEDRAKGMGMIGAAFGLGFVVGPAIGGVLSRYGMAAPFLAAAGVTLANALLAVVRLPESLPPARRQAQSRGFGLADRLRLLFGGATSGRLRALYAAGFLATLAFAAMEGTFSLWADARWHVSAHSVAYLFAYLGVVSVIAQGALVGRMVKRAGERRTALLGMALIAAGLAAAALATSMALLLAGVGVLALGQGMASPSVSSLISHQGGAGEQGRLLGVYQSLSALGRVAGPVIGGVALQHVGLSAPFLAASGIAAAAAVVLALLAGGAA